ncbi:MAG TPA: carboxyltransferase domain-containing protein [Thermoanaerobaculia bacterium]|nr:carboxyltransferase domain-containing protein [Thermoanaerobaculia bacterium]
MKPAGERAWLLEWAGDESAANGKARAAAAALRAAKAPGFLDAVPSARTCLVLGGPGFDASGLPALEADPPASAPGPPPRAHELRFTPDGPDLDEIASRCGLPPESFLRAFTDLTFTVGFLGFTPGFAYLYGLPPAFHLPRRPSPRTAVPAGSVALAGPYAGVYPGATPGGWNLLGTTAQRLFDLRGDPPFLFSPGDTVRFAL